MTKKDVIFDSLDELPEASKLLIPSIFVIVLIISTYLLAVIMNNSLSWILFVCSLLALPILPIFFNSYGKKLENALFNFASDNSFTYKKEVIIHNEVGTLFQGDHLKKGMRVFTGELSGLPMVLGDYSYVSEKGKSQSAYPVRILSLTLPRKLPHMVIDCLLESNASGYSTLPIRFNDSQKIDLEGDFPKYFSLYAPDNYAISALSIIAPDVMETLMRMQALCDIEIINNKIYFYSPETNVSKTNYIKLLQTVEEIMLEIGKKLSKSDIFAHKDQATLHAEVAEKPVVLEEKLGILKDGHFSYVAFTFGVLIFSLGNPGFAYSITGSINGVLLFDLLAILAFIAAVTRYRLLKSRRKKLKENLQKRYSMS